jgi:glutamate/aspartate transport system substrate-binding protein
MRTAAIAAFALACGLAWGGDDASGATRAWSDALSGRLQHIKETRTVRLGYRENAIPFSYLGPDERPIGYSIDLCHAIVATIGDDLDDPALRIEYVRVTAQDRIERVVSGTVDLECGATTNTAERRAQVAFSPVIFVTGTRLAVARESRIRGFDDLKGRPVAIVRGTTNEAAARDLDRLRALALQFVPADNYREALASLVAGKADALAADDVLLRGLLVETGKTADFRLVGDMVSFEPYGIMYAKGDSALADAVDRTLRGLAESREIVWTYNRWFMRPLPARGALALPMSVQLRRSLELIGLPSE